MKKERRSDQTSIHVIADIAAKPELRSLQKGYANINNSHSPRSADLQDFNVEERVENPIKDAEESFQKNLEVSLRSLAKKIGGTFFIVFALIP